MIQFRLPILAVRSVDISKEFYQVLFRQKILLDLGEYVSFSDGFAIQQDLDRVVGIPKSTILHQANNMEMYFEVDDFDTFIEQLRGMLDVELVHLPKKCKNGQRVVRLYDPDWHMIKVSETMESVAKRLLSDGCTVEQTAQMIGQPVSFVEQIKKGMK